MPPSRAILVPAAGSAGLWLVVAGLHALITRLSPPPADGAGPLGPLRLLVPETVPDFVWVSVAPWPVVVPALAAAVVFCLVGVGASVVVSAPGATSGARRAALLWAVIAVAGAVVLVALTTGMLLADPVLRWRLVADRMMGTAPAVVAWALVWAWIPVVLSRTASAGRVAQGAPRRILPIAVAALAISALLIVALPATVTANRAATGQGTPSVLPPAPLPSSPAAVPPPLTAAIAAEPDPSWCSPDELTFADGGGDAATGHRAGAIRVTNSGTRSCVLDGYPDLAFADGSGNAVAASVTTGGSFMTEDPGPTALTLRPGDVAVSYAGWDATDGRSVLSDIYVAPWAGTRRTVVTVANAWDLTNQSVVFVTAWQAEPGADPYSD